MRAQIIDDQMFFGRNLLTAQEAVAEQRSIIDAARAKMAELAEQERRARAALEAALLADEPTEQHRRKLTDIAAESKAPQRAIAEAEGAITDVQRQVDTREGARIAAAGNQAIAAALQSLQIPENLRHAA